MLVAYLAFVTMLFTIIGCTRTDDGRSEPLIRVIFLVLAVISVFLLLREVGLVG